MNLSRIKQLKEELEAEDIDTQSICDIEAAFSEIPDSQLRDLRENAMACDMLDELEDNVSKMELAIYNWVADNFGENEAMDPSWDIGALAKHLNDKLSKCEL